MILDVVPLWGMFLATIALVLLSVECGYRLGRYRQQCGSTERDGPVGAMVSATLALLAFLLAFTFSMAASRFEDRRQAMVHEANAVGTTYLRAALLPDPVRSEIRRLLREYVDIRLSMQHLNDVAAVVARSEEIHAELWAQTIRVTGDDPRSIVAGLFVQTLNETIDLHTLRVSAGLYSRIPDAIWGVLFLVTFLAMGVTGYQEGLTSSHRTPAVLALVLAFAGVIYLIADLDRTHEGTLSVSRQSLLDLQRGMQEASP